MVLLLPVSRLSEYGEDIYNHFKYNLHSDILSGAIRATIVICPAVSTSPEIKTAVDSLSSVKEAVCFTSDLMPAVSFSTTTIPTVSSIVQISYPNEVTT